MPWFPFFKIVTAVKIKIWNVLSVSHVPKQSCHKGGRLFFSPPDFLCNESFLLGATVGALWPGISVARAGHCMGVCCPRVAKVNIALVLKRLQPLKQYSGRLRC